MKHIAWKRRRILGREDEFLFPSTHMNNPLKVAAHVFMAIAVLSLGMGSIAQEAYPSRSIKLIVPYAVGGTNNLLARLLGQKLTDSWGQSVVVDNKPGGNTIIGSEALIKAPADGYTLIVVSVDHAIIPQLVTTPYDAVKDFAPVATLGISQLLLVAHPSLPANTVQEVIALAKSKPDQLSYASAGNGTLSHITSEMVNLNTGIKMQQIPYKGGGAALVDLVGGQVPLFFSVPVNAIPYVKGGRLKAIAVTGPVRLSSLPQTPTFSESGMQGIDAKAWFGVLAPVGTPKRIIAKLSGEINRIFSTPDMKEALSAQGLEPFISTPEQFASLIETDRAMYAKVIKAANIKIEN